MAGKRKVTGGEPRTTWKGRLKRALVWTSVSGLVLALVGVATFVYLYKTIDIPEPNAEFLTQTSFVYYDDGKTELGRFATQFRDSISLNEMPASLKDAVVAAENRSFYTDKGIDPKGILRAAFSNASGSSTQGASTITQQYVKILYLNQERSYKRKVKEAILSLKVQRTLSKQEVLQGYLNTIYFGRGAYGVEAASNAYFDKPAKKLNLRESAVLASVLNNPTRFDPAGGREAKAALKVRYDYVLDGMLSLDNIGRAQHDLAIRRLPKFPKIEAQSTYGGQKGHLLKMVKDQLLETRDVSGDLFTEERIDGGGLRVTTTFTKKAMDAAQQGVAEVKPTNFPGAKQLHVAVATVQPGTGAVRGIFAGQDYLDSQINWAVAGGQAGSTFKPFAVATALKEGYSLSDTFDGNSPIDINGTDFENENDNDYGTVSLTTATQDSINTAFIDLTNSMTDGPEKIIKTANAMGIPPQKAAKDPYGFPDSTPGLRPELGVTLGSQTVSPINLANGYATIASGGEAANPFIIEKVTDAKGKVLYEHQVATRQAISSDIAADVSYAMQQVVKYGTASSSVGSTFDREAAGKTGTATKTGGAVSSSWYAGFTPQLSTAVMYVRGPGNGKLDDWLPTSADGRPGYFGGNYPAKTWTAVMTRDMEGVEPEDFPPPAYVDGDAPESGHVYVPPPVAPVAPAPPAPPPTRRPTKRPDQPSGTDGPTLAPPTKEPPTSEPPTSEPPTSEPPTSEPPTSAPPTSAPPTPVPPTPAPPTSKPAGGPGGGPSAGPARAQVAASRGAAPWWAAWSGLWA